MPGNEMQNGLTEIASEIQLSGARRPFACNHRVVLLEVEAVIFIGLREILQAAVVFFNTFDPIAYALTPIEVNKIEYYLWKKSCKG